MGISTNTTSLEEILEAVNELPEYVEPIKPETPTISVSSSGLITATANDKSATKQLSTQAAATITPGTSNKTAVASGKYTTGTVTVKGDSNLVPENIKSGVSIFGVSGSVEASNVKFGYVHLTEWYMRNNLNIPLPFSGDITKLAIIAGTYNTPVRSASVLYVNSTQAYYGGKSSKVMNLTRVDSQTLQSSNPNEYTSLAHVHCFFAQEQGETKII